MMPQFGRQSMSKDDSSSWHTTIINTWDAFASEIINAAPQLLGAFAVLLAGWIIAQLLRVSTRKLIRGLDSLWSGGASEENAGQLRVKRTQAIIAGNVVFWVILSFFVATAAHIAGWGMLSAWMDNIILYLPNLISGLLIILSGFLVSNFVRKAVISTAESAGMTQGSVLARISQIVVIFTALLIGIEQIGVNVDFLTNVLIVIVGVLLAGAALAFGLGAQTLVANVIGAQYLRKHCRIGERMRLGDVEGSIVEVTQTSIVLDTQDGRAVIPAKQFQELISKFRSRTEEHDEILDEIVKRED
jgi:small-conductance mechanosensitive channel